MTDKIIIEHLGIAGRMISSSKSTYRQKNPSNVPIFNANIVIEEENGVFKKMWYGDLDLTIDEGAIRKIALAMGCKIYVLPEMAARFETEKKPNIGHHVFWTDGFKSGLSGGYYPVERLYRDEHDNIRYNNGLPTGV